MEIIFEQESSSDKLRVKPIGDLDLYASVDFYNTFAKKILEKHRSVLIDCSELRYLDSSGVGAFIRIIQLMKTIGGELFVINLKGTPRKILEMSNIISLLTILPDELSQKKG